MRAISGKAPVSIPVATIFNTKVLRLMTLTCILYLKELRVEHPCGLVAALLSASTQVSNFVGRRSIAGRPLVSHCEQQLGM